MSIDATRSTWLLTKGQVTSTEKLLLLSCADRAGENGICWPSVKRLSADTGLDRKTVLSVRQSIIDKGLIRFTGELRGKTKSIPVMQLTYVEHRYKNDAESSPKIGIPSKLSSPKNGTAKQSQNWDTESKRYKPKINKENITFSNTKESDKFLVTAKSQPLTTVQKINTLDLPNEFLDRLISIRKANKASVSKLSIEAVYQELIKLKDAGLDLNECLNMYANCGWKGFIAEWFINSKAKNQSNHLDHDSMAWADGFKNNPLYDMESYKNG